MPWVGLQCVIVVFSDHHFSMLFYLGISGNYTIKTTFALTAVAIMDRGTSDKVEIRLRIPPADRTSQRLDVRVNGEAIVFDDGPMAWQDFKGIK